ncbi:hypothetical protein Tco_0211636 [Tanacetum coccineum]
MLSVLGSLGSRSVWCCSGIELTLIVEEPMLGMKGTRSTSIRKDDFNAACTRLICHQAFVFELLASSRKVILERMEWTHTDDFGVDMVTHTGQAIVLVDLHKVSSRFYFGTARSILDQGTQASLQLWKPDDRCKLRCLAAPAFPSSPLPIVPHPYGSPNHVRAPPGFRAAMAFTASTTPVDRREDTPGDESPPHKRLCLTTLTSRYEVGESSTAAPRPTGGHGIDYGFIGTLDAKTRRQRATEVGYEIRDVWESGQTGCLCCVEVILRIDRLSCSRESMDWGQLLAALGQIQALQARASTTVGLVYSFLVSDNHNNMPPRRSSATARTAAIAAATPYDKLLLLTAIEARVSAGTC